MNSITDNLAHIHAQIQQAETEAHRHPGSVNLLAVSKTQTAAVIAAAYLAGQRHFGENYLQEALQKQTELSAFDICWHFIGPIQTNKTRLIATRFAWVHSVDRFKIAERLSAQRPTHLPPLNICLQVNISQEQSKSGIMLADLPAMVASVQQLPNLRLRGVMAIPEPESNFELQRVPFRTLFHAVQQLHKPELDTYSMGMSADLVAAIVEGATWVRIGSALFGART